MTLQQLRDRLSAYLAAETSILKAQEYQVGQGSTARRLTRADLSEVRDEIRRLQGEIAQAERSQAGGRRVTYLRPF
ncbi:DUF6148 family protein [Pseudacidovorax sp. NFM-22]|uniref:DUF6148 family protein n=1 Tax=Pseudacidovorax sp. NFM-22 TaxID=2744469 RepID=UPI001F25EDC3|nr:DUF6148 family protein [Pseudacidovorax sp. NFM-22]